MQRGGYTGGYPRAHRGHGARQLNAARVGGVAPAAVVTDHNDCPRMEVVGNGVQVGQDDRGDIRSPATGGAAEKDDGGARRPLTGKKGAEVDVSRDQRPPLVRAPLE